MLRVMELDAWLAELVERREASDQEVEAAVRPILEAVRRDGDAALYDLTRRFDGVDLRERGLEVGAGEWDAALAAVPADLMTALETAAANVRDFHQRQLPRSWLHLRPDGSLVGQQVTPVDRAGIYVPGGQAPLYSCLIMTVIPAVVAGVREVIVCSPPGPDGDLPPALLAAARLAGAHRVFKVGGAQAVAAMAYGTGTVPAVDLIAGPGNPYVTKAKQLVYGRVGIDMLAGPSELTVVDDGTVPAEWVAADLLSQAEHVGGSVLLVALGRERVDEVNRALSRRLEGHPHRAIMVENLGQRSAALVMPTLDAAAEAVNAVAPEHLELLVTDPLALLPRIRHAGSIF
ncbi:MAG TPA: histidinol dehydrogenase, partial [Bacillota bacterium]